VAYRRPSQRELADAKNVIRRQEMNRAIAEGRLTVRTRTPEERAQSDARWAAAAGARAARKTSRSR